MYEKIAKELGAAGYERTPVQCRDKLKKLKGEYKKVKDNNNETGRKRKNWKFYDAVNDVLGNKPATQPPVVIDTLADELQHDLCSVKSVNSSEFDADHSVILTDSNSEVHV